jgi:hypothetical protein
MLAKDQREIIIKAQKAANENNKRLNQIQQEVLLMA